MTVNENVFSQFIKAKTPEVLAKKMRKMQLQERRYIAFHDRQFANGFWYAWYEKELILNNEKGVNNAISK